MGKDCSVAGVFVSCRHDLDFQDQNWSDTVEPFVMNSREPTLHVDILYWALFTCTN